MKFRFVKSEGLFVGRYIVYLVDPGKLDSYLGHVWRDDGGWRVATILKSKPSIKSRGHRTRNAAATELATHAC